MYSIQVQKIWAGVSMKTALVRELEKSYTKIESWLTPETLQRCKEKYMLDPPDFGLGAMIKLRLLRPRSILYKLFVREGCFLRDEMTQTILGGFSRYLHGE